VGAIVCCCEEGVAVLVELGFGVGLASLLHAVSPNAKKAATKDKLSIGFTKDFILSLSGLSRCFTRLDYLLIRNVRSKIRGVVFCYGLEAKYFPFIVSVFDQHNICLSFRSIDILPGTVFHAILRTRRI
jgi:hypothetical protein